MPDRISSWALYDVFTVKDGEQIFLAAVSDAQWVTFCDAMGYADLKANPQLATNNDRVRARPTLMPDLRQRLANHSAAELAAIFEKHGLPFAPSRGPSSCWTTRTSTPPAAWPTSPCPMANAPGKPPAPRCCPLAMDGQRLGVRLQPRCWASTRRL